MERSDIYEILLLSGFYRLPDQRFRATYEHIQTGATCTVTVQTLERAAYEDERLKDSGYAPILRPPEV